MEIGEDDLFLTTSWWTTTSVLGTVPARQVVYLLQEDERCFYPVGAQTIGATAAMDHPDLRVVVNTEALLRHLESTGVTNLGSTGISFEPSFEPFLRAGRALGSGRTRQLFFYARPHNPRNLFDLGVAAIDGAIEAGYLPRERWRVVFVGRNVPAITFCDGSRPVVYDRLGWHDYRELLGGVDLGLSLMASPHPSYPPLDLAASGSVVVTNTWPGKPDLAKVSDRILLTDATVEGLVTTIGRATALIDELAAVPFLPGETPMFTPWLQNLEPVVATLVRDFGDV